MNNDLISRSALLEAMPKNDEIFSFEVRRVICNAPAVDAEVVRHGRWIMRGGYIRCSECDAKTLWKDTGGTGGFSHEYEQVRANYCPNCGAKMDAEVENHA